jgi:hypothetical protein
MSRQQVLGLIISILLLLDNGGIKKCAYLAFEARSFVIVYIDGPKARADG